MRLLKQSARGCAALALMIHLGCAPSGDESDWPDAFGYSSSEVISIEIGSFGFPKIPIIIGDHEVFLTFDTGNMVGVSLNTELFDQLGLSPVRTWNRFDGAGDIVATLRVGEARRIGVLGREIGKKEIHEHDHPMLTGLFGPADLEAGHFTLDYGTRRLAAGSAQLPQAIPGYQSVPLVRSDHFPTLILVRGTIEGRSVVMQLDTGKSRTVVNPDLAADLDLRKVKHGVRIDSLQIGDLSFSIRSAKEVDQTAIAPELSETILAGIGSDILSQFIWTVDYDTGLFWLPVAE